MISNSCPAQCLFDQPERDFSTVYPYFVALLLHYLTSIWRVFETSIFDHYLLLAPRKMLQEMKRKPKSSLPNVSNRESEVGIVRIPLVRCLVTVAIWMYLALGSILGSLTISLYYDLVWFSLGVVSIMGNRQVFETMMDGDENELTFGQIVPVLLLASIVLTFKEVYTGKLSCLTADDWWT